MYQEGILATEGIYSLENNITRLVKDHDNAQILAHRLSKIEQIHVDPDTVQTNIIFANIDADMKILRTFLKDKGIIIWNDNNLRIVIHLDIAQEDVEYTGAAFEQFY
jgi:threonine aldolase